MPLQVPVFKRTGFVLILGYAAMHGFGATGFEAEENYQVGQDISSVAAWADSPKKTAEIRDETAKGGSQSLKIQSAAEEQAAVLKIPAQGELLFIDFQIRPIADASVNPAYSINANGAVLGFLKETHGGTIVVQKSALKEAVDTKFGIDVDESNLASDWIRITIRENLKNGTWDLFVDGRLALIDQKITLGYDPKFVTLKFFSSAQGPAYLDDILISESNPLFLDADNDGIPDAVELVHGTDPNLSDRNAGVAGSTNIDTFLNETSKRQSRNAMIGGRRVIYVDGRNGSDRFSGSISYKSGRAGEEDGPKASLKAAIVSFDNETAFALMPFEKPYGLIERAVGSDDTIYLIPLGDISITTEK